MRLEVSSVTQSVAGRVKDRSERHPMDRDGRQSLGAVPSGPFSRWQFDDGNRKMWLDLAIALSCGTGGLICGWIMHAIGGFGNHKMIKQATQTAAGQNGEEDPSRERISEVADRLRSYAVSMAADVDAHQTRVQAVNNSLSNDQCEGSPEAVFEAINQLIEANEQMQVQLQSAQDQIHDQAVQIESAERRAQTDALTRVPNRGAFDDHLAKRHSMGVGKAGTLALLDVDHFKQFNDVYGHRAGDEVLRVVAKVLHARLHSQGLVARFGGEEFAVILDGCSIEEAKDLVESARIAIGERDIQFEDKRLRVAACAGVAELVAGESIEKWLQRADDALYRSKEVGRNCGHWMDEDHPIRIELDQDQVLAPSKSEPTSETKPEPLPSAPSTDGAQPEEKEGALAYLPDREVLGETFSEMRDKTQAMSMYVMSVRCNGSENKSEMRSLLQIVRATLRAVDRIGFEDDSTLLVCMPSIDESTACERGRQICRSADAIQLGGDQPNTVTIGITSAGSHDDFAEVAQRASDLAEQAHEEGIEPVRLFESTVPA